MLKRIDLSEARKTMREFKDKDPETYIELYIVGGFYSKKDVEKKIAEIKKLYPGWITLTSGYAFEGHSADMKAVVLHHEP